MTNTKMTVEELLSNTTDAELLGVYEEIATGIVPASGKAHTYCRSINKMIDKGTLCINPTTYRKVYLPTLAKMVLKEMANRYHNYLNNCKTLEDDYDI